LSKTFKTYGGENAHDTRLLSASLATIIALIGATEAIADNLCRPALALDEVEFSAMIPPTLERVWSAVV
jgi:hypothetical protein